MGKSLLILGNGFDLAHGLPTRYSDFLDFSLIVLHLKRFNLINIDTILEYGNHLSSNSYAQKIVFSEIENLKNNDIFPYIFSNKHLEELSQVLLNNVWYSYLEELYINNKFKGENWIDFESEICFIIKMLDKNCKNLTYNYEQVKAEIPLEIQNSIEYREKFAKFDSVLYEHINEFTSMIIIRKRLYTDLINLTIALEIYLKEFASKTTINKHSKDISDIKPDYVINFNYTDTFKQVYMNSAKIAHIHGVCRKDRQTQKNCMVLGIDEYWSDDEKDTHTNFTIFKKFAQRIQKRTGQDYKRIHDDFITYFNIECVKKHAEGTYKENYKPNIYIFGHSLDVTDKDILKLFLNEDAFKVTIFCHDEETEGEYIANVIKIIGEDKLIKKVNTYPPQIEFVIQQEMKAYEEITTEQEKNALFND